MDYAVKFNRYDSRSGRSLTSGVWFTKADDFRGALANAEILKQGMREGGLADTRLEVESIVAQGYTRSEQCVGSILNIWETLTEREAAAAEATRVGAEVQ